MGGIFEDPKLCPKVLLDFLMHMTFVCFTYLVPLTVADHYKIYKCLLACQTIQPADINCDAVQICLP